uniref:MAPKKK4 mitogen-activated protein kinase kinase kinase 4 n=1 Tax=Phallusia mammillata TaxID=59560 RepID=A0A6F9DKG7_9ASCI|nr:MAPKKK4 mitogen-activated protein kinase kinase kinase 4 [Phallusia mammillata]
MTGKTTERVQYFRGLRLLVDVGRERSNESEKLQPNASSVQFRKYFNNILWLELKAHHSNRSLIEQDKWVLHQRQKSVTEICSKVEAFRFQVSEAVETDKVSKCGKNPPCKCYLRKSVERLSGDYLKSLFAGMHQVLKIQEDIEFVEDLYSSMTGVVQDYPEFGNPVLQHKIQTLTCWLNTSSELMWTLLAMVNLLGSMENKEHITGFLYDLDLLDLADDSVDEFVPKSYLSISHLMFSCCSLTESVLQMTELQFIKRSVQNIHMQLVKNYFGCLVRSRNVICQDNRHNLKSISPETANSDWKAMVKTLTDMGSLVEHIQNDELDKTILMVLQKNPSDGVISSTDFWGLPELEPLHVFLSNIIFAIMSQCLQARLQQSLSCKEKCSSSTSLLTVQQVVAECKEVIECSVLALAVHLFLMHSLHSNNSLESFELSTVLPFRSNLMSLFKTYMDFVQLLVIGQLNGLPHAPHTFIDILYDEWNFAKRISLKLGLGDECTKKYIHMCTEVFQSTQTFLESAVNAIITSKANVECSPVNTNFSASFQCCMSLDNSLTPKSPQAGVLWFHRQRSESPHLAHMHSVFDDSGSQPDEFLAVQSPFSDDADAWDPVESTRRYLFELGRAIRDMFHEVRERFTRATHYATVLKEDLECAMTFRFIKDVTPKKSKAKGCEYCSLLSKLAEYNCLRVVLDHNLQSSDLSWLALVFDMSQFYIFVRCEQDIGYGAVLKEHILKTLISCMSVSNCLANSAHDSDVLFVVRKVNCTNQTPKCSKKHIPHQCTWPGREIVLSNDDVQTLPYNNFPEDLLIDFSHDMTVVCFKGSHLPARRKEICKLSSKCMKIDMMQTSVIQQTQDFFSQLHQSVLSFCETLMNHVYNMSEHLQKQVRCQLCAGGHETEMLVSEINQITQRIFNIGFECLQCTCKLLSGTIRRDMDKLQAAFVRKWMLYILKHLPRGNGKKPRWAAKGLKFLVTLNLDYIRELSDEDYKEFKDLTNRFFDHLIGSKNKPGVHHLGDSQTINAKVVYRSLSGHSSKASDEETEIENDYSVTTQISSLSLNNYLENVRTAILDLEYTIDKERYDNGVIGRVLDATEYTPIVQLHIRSASFRWQRGKKIGEGTFGKVYTCVNMDTGKILAMKEIQFQAHDERKVKEILDEMANFEGMVHQNLVRYFGVEIHRDLMFIFMEYCDSGTLADISQIGLPEVMIQQYTSQLVTAVHVLHRKGIVHRDIKGSNIFLMSNSLIKLGDFGSAIRLMDRTKTSPGEIVSRTGITTAYTAPEVINSVGGYGRAADVWSIGCVVIEMASGKRPWHDHEPFQIMYKVGMGNKPTVPATLSHDGQNFIGHCLEVDTNVRWTVAALQSHQFVKVGLPLQE